MSLYSDLNSFSPTDRALLIDLGAIYQSIFNILNTQPGERLFEPEFGVDFDAELFELVDDVSAVGIFTQVTEAIERFEDRVIVDFGSTEVVPDEENHIFRLNLVFQVIGFGNDEEDPTKFTFQGSLAA